MGNGDVGRQLLKRRPARAGWLLSTIALGAALVGASIANYRGARAAFDTLNRGQVGILENAVRQAMMGTASDAAALRDALDEHAAAGLSYVALLSDTGTVIVDAGTPAGAITLPTDLRERARESGFVMTEVDGRVRAILPRSGMLRPPGPGPGPMPSGQPPAVAGPAPGPPATPIVAEPRQRPDRPGQAWPPPGPPPSPPSHLLIEFEPIAAAELMAQAGRSLALGTVVAILLTVAALGFWRQSVRYERERSDFEQHRRLSQLGEMSAVLAHEIHNPLASLKGNAQLLAERLPAGGRDRAKADRVVSEATRLESLTTDLLEFARSAPDEPRPEDPVMLARSAIEEVAHGGITLDASAAPAEWALDAVRMRHALVNILRNAVQASPGQPPELTVAQEEGDLLFQVRDFGEGLAPGTEERVFDPFFTTRATGTGLGLAVARRAVESHHGRIEARNHPGGGAVFRMILPRQHG